MNLLKQINSILFCAVVMIGCASTGKNFDSRKINDIQKGKTTEADLVSMFGQPNQRGQNASGAKTMMWLYSESAINGKQFIPFAGPFLGGVDTKNKSLTVMLASDGTVEDYNYTGGGFQTTGSIQEDPEKKPK
jgi:hypothetical protein